MPSNRYAADEDDIDETKPLLGLKDEDKPQYKVSEDITLRSEPRLDADRTGKILKKDTEFFAHDIVSVRGNGDKHWDHLPVDELCFVQIGEDEGWAISRHPVTDETILQPLLQDNGSTAQLRFRLRTFFQTRIYEWSITAVILLNAAFIWAEIDSPNALPASAWSNVNVVFSSLYVIEISTKMYAYGVSIYFESYWNIFDFVVTAVTVLSDLAPLFIAGNTAKKIRKVSPVIRLLRLLRLANMFQGLKTLMRSFTSSLGALVWIAVFIVIWFFICGCLTTVFMGRKEFFPDSAATSPADAQRLRGAFHSVPYSMYTLFEVMTIEGWIDVVRPIVKTQPVLVLFFFVFVFVAGFFLLNLVTAVVVDRTVQAQEECEKFEEEVQNDKLERTVHELINEIKAQNDQKDVIARKDLQEVLQQEKVMLQLKKVEWDPELADAVCAVIDKSQTGKVDLAMLQSEISNAARPIDTMRLVRFQADLSQRLERQEKMLEQLLSGTK